VNARWLLVAVWLLVIFGVSSLQGSSLPSVGWDYSQLGHFAGYAILGGLMVFALGADRLTLRAGLALLLACSLYGVSDEYHQSFVAGRTPDVADWMVDTAGAGVAIAAIALVRARRNPPGQSGASMGRGTGGTKAGGIT
jgi:VanZ family protein